MASENRVGMQTPDDLGPPEAVDLEEEANSRGYFADDGDDSDSADSSSRPGSPTALQPVPWRRR